MNFKLLRNIMHQTKSLRDSFIPPQGAIETFHYPGYVILCIKNDEYRQKGKSCTKNLHENDVSAN